MPRFVDTNVLLYAVSTARDEAHKSRIALALLDSTDLALSVQVLQEFFVQATRATKAIRITDHQACALVESWLRFPVQALTVEVMRAAMTTRDRFRIPYWDAAIIEAARALDCRTVLSEDLNAGQDYGGVSVVNPFPPGSRGQPAARRQSCS